MTATPDAKADAAARRSFIEALAVYLKPRVLIVLLLGFSSGLPLALSGSTLAVWLTDNGNGGASMVAGHGLSGLAERVHGLGGELVVDSPVGGPSRIGARIPLG